MPPNSDNSFTPTTGIQCPKHRDVSYKNAFLWLKDKRDTDGAEGLWRVHDKLYDLRDFIRSHPGGQDWIKLTRGTDITEAFETHHITNAAEKLLPRHYVKDATTPRNYPFTFHENGFYKTLKRNVREALKEIPKKKIAQHSKNLIDTLCILIFVVSIAANYYRSYALGILASYFLACTTVAAHNFFHLADNFRMYYFDLSLLDYKEWRISHSLSHHSYPNSIADLEISMFEPFLRFLPSSKSTVGRYVSCVTSPLVWTLLCHLSAIKRYVYYYRRNFEHFTITEFIPYAIPLAMYLFTGEFLSTLLMWTFIMLVGSFLVGMIGLNAAHHHPDIFHEGDAARPENERDWGIYQLDCVMDRHEINASQFLVLTNFGEHGLHHLFPTLDHAILKQIWPILMKTTEEFNIALRVTSQVELMKGQFQQLVRIVPNKFAKYCNKK